MVRKSVLFSLAIVALGIVTIYSQAQSVLTHHVREATRNGRAKSLRRLPADQVLQLNIVLPLSDQAGLDAFLKDVYNPSSPHYRHFLTVAEFTSRSVVGGSRDGMDVQIKGPVSAIETAFHVNHAHLPAPHREPHLLRAGPRAHYGPAFPLWHISGLDNYSIPHPMFVKKSDYAKAHGMSRRTSCPMPPPAPALRLRSGQRHARGLLRRNALTGAGQNLGLFEYAGHRSGRPDHLFQERRSNQQCAHHPALHGRDQHILRGFERRRQAATTPNRPST
jgi:hypothetical protein